MRFVALHQQHYRTDNLSYKASCTATFMDIVLVPVPTYASAVETAWYYHE